MALAPVEKWSNFTEKVNGNACVSFMMVGGAAQSFMTAIVIQFNWYFLLAPFGVKLKSVIMSHCKQDPEIHT